ncbi:7992_t:CDS:1, partial [Acaulospora colombiana]
PPSYMASEFASYPQEICQDLRPQLQDPAQSAEQVHSTSRELASPFL